MFSDGVVHGENRLCLGEFAYHAVVTLHCVGGADDPPDPVRELKEGRQLRPVFIPGFQDIGVSLKNLSCPKLTAVNEEMEMEV